MRQEEPGEAEERRSSSFSRTWTCRSPAGSLTLLLHARSPVPTRRFELSCASTSLLPAISRSLIPFARFSLAFALAGISLPLRSHALLRTDM
jgi:hypothetical protein